MKLRPPVILGFLLIALMAFGLSLPAQAAPAQQQFATNTPLPDGVEVGEAAASVPGLQRGEGAAGSPCSTASASSNCAS